MDYILFVIAFTLCSSILIMITVPLVLDKEITDSRADLIKESLVGLAVIMTTWFGAKIQGQRDKDD